MNTREKILSLARLSEVDPHGVTGTIGDLRVVVKRALLKFETIKDFTYSDIILAHEQDKLEADIVLKVSHYTGRVVGIVLRGKKITRQRYARGYGLFADRRDFLDLDDLVKEIDKWI